MNRRGFLGTLAALCVAPFAPKAQASVASQFVARSRYGPWLDWYRLDAYEGVKVGNIMRWSDGDPLSYRVTIVRPEVNLFAVEAMQ
jgi:hypothetical protein